MARGTVFHRHATVRTEQMYPESSNTFRMGYSYCDPKHAKRIAPSAANDWRGRTGVHAPADQTEEDLFKTNCPDCAKAWGKAQAAALGDRLSIEKIEPINSYTKSLYRVSLDGTVRGYISIANGWGEKWKISSIAREDRDLSYSNNTGEPVGQSVNTNGIFPIHISSMNGLASLFPKLVEDGKLPTREEQVEAKRKNDEEQAAREAQRRLDSAEFARKQDIARQEREERRTLARDAVQAVSDRAAALGLSNSETMGLLEALKLL